MTRVVQCLVKALLGLIVCLLLLPNSSSDLYTGFSDERPFRVRTTRFICLGPRSTRHIDIHECRLRLLRNGSSLASFNATILQPLNSVWATMKIMYKTSSHVFQPMLGIDEKADICHLVGTDRLTGSAAVGNMFYGAVRNVMKRYTPQLLRPCPLVGHYSFINLTFHDKMFPPFLPAGDYRNDMRVFLDSNETLVAMQFYGSVRAKGIADLSMG